MSDFDKEAEREKLRKKFEAEEQQREATEQMSELLLKGATMTNAHCSDCGDPIFRYDGQEFCPTCQKPITREPADGDAADDGHIEVANPGDEASVQFGQAAESADEPVPETDNAGDESASVADEAPAETAPEPTRPDRADQTPDADVNGTTPDATTSSPNTDPTPATERTPLASSGDRAPDTGESASGSVQTDLDAAEQHLARTVRKFAARAAETDNPRRAVEQLEAAREAAEALDAL